VAQLEAKLAAEKKKKQNCKAYAAELTRDTHAMKKVQEEDAKLKKESIVELKKIQNKAGLVLAKAYDINSAHALKCKKT
jgi:hypothetical protein